MMLGDVVARKTVAFDSADQFDPVFELHVERDSRWVLLFEVVPDAELEPHQAATMGWSTLALRTGSRPHVLSTGNTSFANRSIELRTISVD